jgi:hypothetical protein
MEAEEILRRIIFVGGPPRSGTTFAAKSLNMHPAFVAAIDDHVYECWGLYYNRDRVGLVQELRSRQLGPDEAQKALQGHLFAEGRLLGAAPSDKTAGYPRATNSPALFPGAVRSLKDRDLVRHEVPLAQFSRAWRLCLKSPEISFVLPQLARLFPEAKFVLVCRPLTEIAESMFRLGNRVRRFPVFQARWLGEKGDRGESLPPPGVPAEWNRLWQGASGFQRCVIYAASYLRALLEGMEALVPGRCFVYNHARLRNSPGPVFRGLARFLAVEATGFQAAGEQIQADLPPLQPELFEEYTALEMELGLQPLQQRFESLAAENDSRCGQADATSR